MMVSMASTVDWQALLLDLLNTTPVIDGQMVDRPHLVQARRVLEALEIDETPAVTL